MQKLQSRGGSGMVTVPKEFLDRDGLLDDDGEPETAHLTVERLGERAYVVRVCDGDIPELAECEEIRRIAAERVLDEDVFGRRQGE
ncbi:hypothetical protein [Haloarcula pellucida]|uniref:DUF8053 domain-containing protein n=1 Tax=Haloarcula pellucida TaxID=1427151 RepID=A0A830GMX0_9EURY|nr:hypothetical protein [Halomicroarcula pellucida]MBX0348672.1 hypothetical protein [Halomicroarcula pellucida]GGN92288.1 hypothetical protein GCM10009030_16380 [Halomicroarcula pellucida]